MWVVRQGDSSNPKGGVGRKRSGTREEIQWPQRNKATIDQTRVGSRYIRIRWLRIDILSDLCRSPELSEFAGKWMEDV
jgi:hypothetical protein